MDTGTDHASSHRRGAAPGLIKPGDTVFVVGTVVAVLPRDGEVAGGISVRLPVRWGACGFQQVIVPIEAIARP